MAQAYSFDSSDFPQGFDLSRFFREVRRDSVLGPLLSTIRESSPRLPFRLDVAFSADLTPGLEAQLLAVVAAHSPTAVIPPGETVAELDARQPGVSAGTTAFARDGRKAGEPNGMGTGVLVYSDGTRWLGSSTDSRPQT